MRLLILLVILVLGAAVLSPVIALIGLDPVPGDLSFDYNHQHYFFPVAYSLCASAVLALSYYIMRR
jgi:hypothetical protein